MFRGNRFKNKNSDFLCKMIKKKKKNEDMLRSVVQEILNYCLLLAKERESELDQNYIEKIIRKQFQKTIK